MHGIKREHIIDFVASKYSVLLITIIGLLIAAPILNNFAIGSWIISIFIMVILSAVIYTMIRISRQFYIFVSLALLNIVLDLINIFSPHLLLDLIANTVFVVIIILAILSFWHEIVTKEKVTGDTVLGAICIYLLIGIAYGVIYSSAEMISPGSFIYNTALGASAIQSNFDLIYFSLITITTVGYGDIIVVSRYVQPVVIIESITGIFFLATLVARLVSMREKK